MARKVGPAGAVIGIERSEHQIADALRGAAQGGEEGLVEFRQGEADRLPLQDSEWRQFDVAHARYLLEHVSDPALLSCRWYVRFVQAVESFWRTMLTIHIGSGQSR